MKVSLSSSIFFFWHSIDICLQMDSLDLIISKGMQSLKRKKKEKKNAALHRDENMYLQLPVPMSLNLLILQESTSTGLNNFSVLNSFNLY